MTPRPTLSVPGDLTGFPTVRPPDWLYRICRGGNRIWWFSCEGSGRFDLHPPEATCYFATDLYAAIREASRLGPVTPQWVAERDACRVSPPDPRARASGVALFGQAGASSMQDGERMRLAAAEVRSAGVQVIEPPDSAVLTVLP